VKIENFLVNLSENLKTLVNWEIGKLKKPKTWNWKKTWKLEMGIIAELEKPN